MSFTEIMRVNLDEFSGKTFSVNDCFDYPGKLFNLQEFDISDENSFSNLITYIKEIESKGKSKLVNILFSDYQHFAPQYYIFHSHVLACCIKLDGKIEELFSSE